MIFGNVKHIIVLQKCVLIPPRVLSCLLLRYLFINLLLSQIYYYRLSFDKCQRTCLVWCNDWELMSRVYISSKYGYIGREMTLLSILSNTLYQGYNYRRQGNVINFVTQWHTSCKTSVKDHPFGLKEFVVNTEAILLSGCNTEWNLEILLWILLETYRKLRGNRSVNIRSYLMRWPYFGVVI